VADYGVEDVKSSVKELGCDLKEFFVTRGQILAAEMKEKITAWKMIATLAAIALACGAMALVVLTGALVYVIAMGIGVGYALLAVGLGYLFAMLLAGGLAYREIRQEGIAPKHTLHVLKQDQAWLKNESRSA